jgi:RNA polymerase sigma factor (sigma-70 family)
MSLATVERYPSVLPEPIVSRPPDGQLLQRYVAARDERAFEALVERYGTLVLGVCQRVLQHSQDAEDAFQATFLVLARRAATLDGRGPLGNWLYAVAYRTAVKVRQSAARRRARELQVINMATVPANDEKDWSDLRPLLDRELNQLPEKYRAPLVLCYLEGKTQEQAAHELGWPTGSMSRRMNRARDLLQKRLARRGIALSTGFLFVLVAQNAGAAVVSPALAGITTQAALVFAAGQAGLGAAVSGHVASIAEEVLRHTGACGPLALEGASKIGKLLIIAALLGLIAMLSGTLVHQVRGVLQPGNDACGTPPKTDAGK